LLFQDDDDDEEEEVPLVRKRKQRPISTSQPDDEEVPTKGQKVKETKKKNKVQELKVPQTQSKDQGDEKRKKKKNEEKELVVTLREKSVIKRTKVPRVLKIHSSSDSDQAPNPKDILEKEILVEKDQSTKIDNDIPGPKEDPLPQPTSLVEDQNATSGGSKVTCNMMAQSSCKMPPILMGKKMDPQTLRSKEKRYIFVYLLSFAFLRHFIVLTNFPFVFVE
jgi:hypothetical protein